MCGIVQILHSIPSKSLFEESSLKFYGLLKKTVSGGYRRIKHCSRIDFVPPCMKFGKIRSQKRNRFVFYVFVIFTM